MEQHPAEHMRYHLENNGVLWRSDPFVLPGHVVGDGLKIFDVLKRLSFVV
jgi:hypothetical protein